MNLPELAEIIERRRREGAKTLNLLGGEPAVSLYGILELLGSIDCETVVVWNSNMYYNDIVDETLRGLADVFLADLKCYDPGCSETILGAADYPQVATGNIAAACEHADVIVRLPVLPGHFDCCLGAAMDWLAGTIPDVKVSLRGDYIPPAVESRAPKEYLSDAEFKQAIEAAGERGLNLIQ
jgi:putative pyruvate formate lyase activating enzyme